MLPIIDTMSTIIEIPPYLTTWDLDKVANKSLRKINPGNITFLNMEKVKNVYVATLQLLLQLSIRAQKLQCAIYMINTDDAVYKVLTQNGINERIPIYEEQEIDYVN